MLKILKRLTAIVLSIMTLLTGGRGYAMAPPASAPGGGDSGTERSPQANPSAAAPILSCVTVDNTVLVGGGNSDFNNASSGLLTNLKIIDYNASEIDHIDLFFGENMLSEVFNNRDMDIKKIIDLEKEIIAIPMQDFFLYPKSSIQDLINKFKLKKELINFYSLSDMSQVDIENDQPPFTYNEKVCRVICHGFINRWIVPVVILISAGAFIVSMIGLAQDGWTKNEKIAAVFLGVLFLFSAGAGVIAARECAKGCCSCCVSDAIGGEAFLKRHSHPPEEIEGSDYFKTLIREEIMIQNDEFYNAENWNVRDTILFFPLKKDKKYVMAIVKNRASLGDRNLPTNFPPHLPFQTIFEKNKDYFFEALKKLKTGGAVANRQVNDHREERNE